jgi:HEAT repeat protein
MRAHLLDDSLYRDSGPALEALLALGPAAAPRLVAVATTSTGEVKRAALDALRRLDRVGGAQLVPLAADLDRLQGTARMHTAAALAHAGDARAQAALLEGLSSEDVDVRVAAARGLAESSAASPAAVDLLAALEREAGKRLHAPGAVWGREWRPYYAYHAALLRTGRGVPAAMVPLLTDPSGDVRTTAAEALGSAGAEGVAVVAAAWPRLEGDAKRAVLRRMMEGGKEPPAGVRELGHRALKDADPAVRLSAAEVLSRLPDFESAVVATRIDLLTAPNVEIARAASVQLEAAVASLGPYAERIRDVEGITDPEVALRVRDLLDALDADRKAQR